MRVTYFSVMLNSLPCGRCVGLLLSCLALGCGPQPAEKGAEKKGEKMEPLIIELRLSKDEYRTSEAVNAEVIFHNRGKEKLLIPVGGGPFFDFLIIGDYGTQYLTRHCDGWGDPIERDIKFIPLDGGQRHKVTEKDIIRLKEFDAGAHPKEQFIVVAIYRNSARHGQVEPGHWTGIAVSPPVSIKRITLAEDGK